MSSTHHLKHCMRGSTLLGVTIWWVVRLVYIRATKGNIVGTYGVGGPITGGYKFTTKTYSRLANKCPLTT
jgi:hypothetical protein